MATEPDPDPIRRFASLFERAKQKNERDADNMVVATVGPGGTPSARFVLLKSFDERGFVFFTNAHGRKGRELAENPQVALVMYYPEVGEQVRVEGRVEPVSPEEADRYFATRPRVSQLGAWASHQSETMPSRELLEEQVRQLDQQFAGKPVPRPDHWSGYRVVPDRIEFWRAHVNRLNERLEYRREGTGWKTRLLFP
ncbi:MAG: pyridoxamine 5'-phosphate oxidase [Myxococcaceae bacterium]